MQVELDEDGARKIFKLIDALEDSDDVQNVFANFDVSDEVMARSTPDVGHAAGRRGHTRVGPQVRVPTGIR